MRANSRCLPRALILAVAALVSACADLPTGPEPLEVVPKDGLLEHVEDVLHVIGTPSPVVVVHWKKALKKDESASAFIGDKGGKIHLKKAGLTVYFPRGAVRHRTKITIVVPAGKLVGYEFLPHGLVFHEPVTVTQDLRKVKGSFLALIAAFHEGKLGPSVIAKERGKVKKKGRFGDLGVFAIQHFSGYVIATD